MDRVSERPRPPERIPPFLNSFAQLWLRHPDQRFGQLILNLCRTPGGFADIWEWDVDEFTKRIVEYDQ